LPTTPTIAKADRVLRFAPALALLAASAAVAASAPVQPEQVPVDVQLQQAKAEASAAVAEQRRLEKAAAQARDEVTRLRAKQLAAAQAIDAAEAEITAADAASRLIETHLAAQRQRLAAQQAPVSSLLAGLVLASRRPPLLFLANSGSVDELVRLRLLVSATAPVISARTAALSSDVRAEQRLQQQATTARARMVESRDDLQHRRNEFAELEERATELAGSRGSQAMGAGDIALASEERLANVETGAASAASSRQIAADLAALGPAPLESRSPPAAPAIEYRLPADASVTDGMAAVSPSGVRSRGITLATRRGTRLVAPASGTVLFAGPFRDYDGVIIINHGKGWKSVLVDAGSGLSNGDVVAIGDPIGVALGPVQLQLLHGGEAVSPALIAGSSAVLSNRPKGG
jgi:septal ring factor EnvC (AmiA/AmiB activator)